MCGWHGEVVETNIHGIVQFAIWWQGVTILKRLPNPMHVSPVSAENRNRRGWEPVNRRWGKSSSDDDPSNDFTNHQLVISPSRRAVEKAAFRKWSSRNCETGLIVSNCNSLASINNLEFACYRIGSSDLELIWFTDRVNSSNDCYRSKIKLRRNGYQRSAWLGEGEGEKWA